jgi:ABC-type nickel/cobalt efflux system permease component RcnA
LQQTFVSRLLVCPLIIFFLVEAFVTLFSCRNRLNLIDTEDVVLLITQHRHHKKKTQNKGEDHEKHNANDDGCDDPHPPDLTAACKTE